MRRQLLCCASSCSCSPTTDASSIPFSTILIWWLCIFVVFSRGGQFARASLSICDISVNRSIDSSDDFSYLRRVARAMNAQNRSSSRLDLKMESSSSSAPASSHDSGRDSDRPLPGAPKTDSESLTREGTKRIRAQYLFTRKISSHRHEGPQCTRVPKGPPSVSVLGAEGSRGAWASNGSPTLFELRITTGITTTATQEKTIVLERGAVR